MVSSAAARFAPSYGDHTLSTRALMKIISGSTPSGVRYCGCSVWLSLGCPDYMPRCGKIHGQAHRAYLHWPIGDISPLNGIISRAFLHRGLFASPISHAGIVSEFFTIIDIPCGLNFHPISTFYSPADEGDCWIEIMIHQLKDVADRLIVHLGNLGLHIDVKIISQLNNIPPVVVRAWRC